jgi:hypothetical protein
MIQRIKWIFLILVLAQGFHSIEEYTGEIWENFPPARILCRLVSDNLTSGFLINELPRGRAIEVSSGKNLFLVL